MTTGSGGNLTCVGKLLIIKFNVSISASTFPRYQ